MGHTTHTVHELVCYSYRTRENNMDMLLHNKNQEQYPTIHDPDTVSDYTFSYKAVTEYCTMNGTMTHLEQ